MRRVVLGLLILALTACGHDSAPPASATEAIQVSPSHTFNKRAEGVDSVELLRVRGEAWEPYTDPMTNWSGFRVRPTAAARPQRLTVTRRWSSGASKVDDLGVAPGGYYIENDHEVHVITRPPARETGE